MNFWNEQNKELPNLMLKMVDYADEFEKKWAKRGFVLPKKMARGRKKQKDKLSEMPKIDYPKFVVSSYDLGKWLNA